MFFAAGRSEAEKKAPKAKALSPKMGSPGQGAAAEKNLKSRALSASHLLSQKSKKVNVIWESEQEYKEWSNNYSQNNLVYKKQLQQIFKISHSKTQADSMLRNQLSSGERDSRKLRPEK